MAEIRQRLTRFLFPSFAAIIAASVVTMTWLTTSSIMDVWRKNTLANLETQAKILADLCAPLMESGQSSRLDSILKPASISSANRLTIFDEQGRVIADSWDDPSRMVVGAKRPEVSQALTGMVSVTSRESYTRNNHMIFVAAPIKLDGRLYGAARVAMTVSSVTKAVSIAYF